MISIRPVPTATGFHGSTFPIIVTGKKIWLSNTRKALWLYFPGPPPCLLSVYIVICWRLSASLCICSSCTGEEVRALDSTISEQTEQTGTTKLQCSNRLGITREKEKTTLKQISNSFALDVSGDPGRKISLVVLVTSTLGGA